MCGQISYSIWLNALRSILPKCNGMRALMDNGLTQRAGSRLIRMVSEIKKQKRGNEASNSLSHPSPPQLPLVRRRGRRRSTKRDACNELKGLHSGEYVCIELRSLFVILCPELARSRVPLVARPPAFSFVFSFTFSLGENTETLTFLIPRVSPSWSCISAGFPAGVGRTPFSEDSAPTKMKMKATATTREEKEPRISGSGQANKKAENATTSDWCVSQ